MGGTTTGADDGRDTAGTSISRVALATIAGLVVTVIATVLLAVASPWLLPIAALLGAAVAGYLARVGRLGGTLLGACVVATVGAATLAGFWLVVTADPPRPGGAGLGLVVGFLFLAFFVLVGLVLGGLGGLTGTVVRTRRTRPATPENDGSSTAEGSAATVDRDPGAPDPAVETATVPDQPASSGRTATTSRVFVGAGLALATCFVPFAVVATGAAVGYLEAAGPKRGAVTAALAGLLATVLLLAGLLLFALLPLNILRPFIFEYFPQLTLVLGAYFVGCCAAGGAVAGALSKDGRRSEPSERSHRR